MTLQEIGKRLPLLLTCPFCGGNPVLVFRKTWFKKSPDGKRLHEFFVGCLNRSCHARCGFVPTVDEVHAHYSPESAAEHWNTQKPRLAIERPQINAV